LQVSADGAGVLHTHPLYSMVVCVGLSLKAITSRRAVLTTRFGIYKHNQPDPRKEMGAGVRAISARTAY